VLLIGHNPALHDLALELAQTGKPLSFAGEKFSHLCNGEFPLSWIMESVGSASS
jgi:phosphohistidine phosphatase SixA